MKRFFLLAVIALWPQYAAAAKQLSLFSNFEGGALGKIERVSETQFRCGVKGESDQDGRNRQANWYYFRVDGAKGQALTLDLVDLTGEYNYRPNRGGQSKPPNTTPTRLCCGFASGHERIKSGSRTSRHTQINSCNVSSMNSKGALTFASRSSAGLRKAERCCCSRSPLKANLLRKRKSSG